MKPHQLFLPFMLFFGLAFAQAQNSAIKGKVTDLSTNQPVPFATVFIEKTSIGATADSAGNFVLSNVPPGTYTVSCSFVGYKNQAVYEVQVSPAKPSQLDFVLESSAQSLNEVQVLSSPFNKTEESPVSMRTIGSAEIFRSPGGNRDISKVIQNLPGVGSTVSFRNDIIVRNGAPNENRFFLDGIEVPNINHFATQGSSGGPVGMINVNFVREVDFYSGAFPANRGNALSCIMDIKQVEGNQDKFAGTFMLGSSDIGLTFDGPIGKNDNLIFSARRSYLQFLFQALALPFLPTYNDFQFKNTLRFKNKSTLTILGLGAIDDFALNTNANDGETDSSTIERNNYILGYLPVNTQWNYTIGASYKMLSKNGYTTVVVSRNHLNNRAFKYRNNIEVDSNKVLDYKSAEIENKFRLEHVTIKNSWKVNYGLAYENALYTNNTFRRIEYQGIVIDNTFTSELPVNKLGFFMQIGQKAFHEKLIWSAGLRTDLSDYSDPMSNALNQISPRLSLSYKLTEKFFWNFNTGRYFQLPSYTVLGYRDALGNLVNKANSLKYIQCDHLVSGFEFNPTASSKITVEGFYKVYSNYPFAIKDSISLANLGGDFGVIGNEAVNSSSKGHSYGVEFFAQQKLSSTFYGILSYTFSKSEFLDKKGAYRPSSWDNTHILNMTLGKKLKHNWEMGMKFRLLGGAPYTPYNYALTAQKAVWDVTRQGVIDWSRLNEERYPVSHSLDIRIDKKWFLAKWAINAYLDIQNVYNFQTTGPSYLNVAKDAAGNPLTDPSNPAAYQLYSIANQNGRLLPAIGAMIDF